MTSLIGEPLHFKTLAINISVLLQQNCISFGHVVQTHIRALYPGKLREILRKHSDIDDQSFELEGFPLRSCDFSQ